MTRSITKYVALQSIVICSIFIIAYAYYVTKMRSLQCGSISSHKGKWNSHSIFKIPERRVKETLRRSSLLDVRGEDEDYWTCSSP
jgi:hypothetical protein